MAHDNGEPVDALVDEIKIISLIIMLMVIL